MDSNILTGASKANGSKYEILVMVDIVYIPLRRPMEAI